MNCAMPDDQEIMEWFNHIKHRKHLDKELKKIGKSLILQMESNDVDRVTQEQFENCLYRVDQAHHHLIDIIKPYLSSEAATKSFTNENLKKEIEHLKKGNAELKHMKRNQKERHKQITQNKEKEKHSDLTKYHTFLETQRGNSYPTNLTLGQNQMGHHASHTDGELLTQQSRLTLEDKKKKAQSQQPIKQLKEKELLAIQQKCQKSVQSLEANLIERDQQLLKLYQENKTLMQQIAESEKNFNQELRKLEEDNKKMTTMVDEFKQLLLKSHNERDLLKFQNVELQEMIQQQKLENKNLNDNVLQHQREIKYLNAQLHYIHIEEQEQNRHQLTQLAGASNQKKIEDQNKNKTKIKSKVESIKQDDKRKTKEDFCERNTLQEIENICENVKKLKVEVDDFSGAKNDEAYLRLTELLLKNVDLLENVGTDGQFVIWQLKNRVMRNLRNLLDVLQAKTT